MPFEFNQAKFDEGEQAFARGLSLASVAKQLNVEIKDPQDGQYLTAENDEQREQWYKQQESRERNVTGFILGYVNGFVQAVRRIDSQMSLPQQ